MRFERLPSWKTIASVGMFYKSTEQLYLVNLDLGPFATVYVQLPFAGAFVLDLHGSKSFLFLSIPSRNATISPPVSLFASALSKTSKPVIYLGEELPPTPAGCRLKRYYVGTKASHPQENMPQAKLARKRS